MLENIRFCSCFGFDDKPENEKRCANFNFTERALKILSIDFLENIVATTSQEDKLKSGIEVVNTGEINKTVLLTQLDKNLYRIPIKYLDSLIRCLFKYLPATYVEGATQTDYYPTCATSEATKAKN